MAQLLYRLGRFAFRRRRLIALIWVALLAAAGTGAALTPSSTSSSITMPGTEAQEAFDLIEERFPGMAADGATARVVLKAPEGERMDDPGNAAAVTDVVTELAAGSERVAAVANPFETGAIGPNGDIAYVQVSYTVKGIELEDADRDALLAAADLGREAGLTVEVGGDALFQEIGGFTAEIIGVLLAAMVLVITLGSLIAAGLPLLTALIGVGIAVSVITVLATPLEFDSTTPVLAVMLGLAVGIDYALFIVSRYRAELADTPDREEAAGRAVGTAGSAVVFAGLTVVIALAGLVVVNIPLLTKMGLAAAGAVIVAVLIAVTLAPALFGFAGERVLPRRERLAARAGNPTGDDAPAPADTPKDRAAKPNHGTRWARLVLRRPVVVLVTAVVGLGVLAIPVASLELGMPDEGSHSPESTQRKAYDLLAEGFGPGFNGPLLVVVDTGAVADPQGEADAVFATVSGTEGVVAAVPPVFNEAGDTAMMTVIPAFRPSSTETEDLVTAIRAETGDNVLVTGLTAMGIDMSRKLSDAMVPYLALVVGLAFLLLVLVFRSLLVPLKAAAGFLLSVLAALGAVVAVFQWGWGAGLLGVEVTGPIMSMMPIFLIGVVFGLAMDYEVFLVTRMREAYVHGESPREAVVTGFRYGARVVTAAAIIMISVFAGFIGSSEAMIKTIGFGLAVAVLLDAFVVRMAIVPAVLALIGRSAWWLPAWLDRIVPAVDVEGEKLARPDTSGRAGAEKLAADAGEPVEPEEPAGEPARV
ncbi:MMPL family transporter [Streptomyces calidiresistens]|uniref:MMPL family transporter n=1 Tax=Streptomyces calidiresistens TaxID=1485586 RepID=A0A7W3T3F4_9ACTN|nr:MMPL family transporter [Streptomyces calidiresistens]MBB0230222.1 MMPL family transporter [Streptomyces calidiresistens]